MGEEEQTAQERTVPRDVERPDVDLEPSRTTPVNTNADSHLRWKFTPIPDEPLDKPWFLEDKKTPDPNDPLGPKTPHGRIVEALYDLITNNEGGRTIGLTGPWGSGKSSVLKRLLYKLRLKGMGEVFIFDAWSHEHDSIHRAFLEKLIDFARSKFKLKSLIDEETNLDKDEIWRREREKLGKSISEAGPRLKNWQLASLVMLFLVPIFLSAIEIFMMSRQSSSSAATSSSNEPIGWVTLTALGVLTLIVVRYSWRILLSVVRSPKSEANTEDTFHKSITSTDAISTTDFQTLFQKLLVDIHLSKGQCGSCGSVSTAPKLVIAIDNMDRVEPNHALEVWAALRAFLQKDSDASDLSDDLKCALKSTWQIVLYDKKSLLDIQGETPRAPAFIEKTFQITFLVPKLVPSRWRRYMRRKLHEALRPAASTIGLEDLPQRAAIHRWSSQARQQIRNVISVFETGLKLEVSPTHREMISFVNDIGSLSQLCCDATITLSHIALFLVHQRNFEFNRENCQANATDLESWLRKAGEEQLHLGLSYTAIGTSVIGPLAAIAHGCSIEEALEVCFFHPFNRAISNPTALANAQWVRENARSHGFSLCCRWYASLLRKNPRDGLRTIVFLRPLLGVINLHNLKPLANAIVDYVEQHSPVSIESSTEADACVYIASKTSNWVFLEKQLGWALGQVVSDRLERERNGIGYKLPSHREEVVSWIRRLYSALRLHRNVSIDAMGIGDLGHEKVFRLAHALLPVSSRDETSLNAQDEQSVDLLADAALRTFLQQRAESAFRRGGVSTETVELTSELIAGDIGIDWAAVVDVALGWFDMPEAITNPTGAGPRLWLYLMYACSRGDTSKATRVGEILRDFKGIAFGQETKDAAFEAFLYCIGASQHTRSGSKGDLSHVSKLTINANSEHSPFDYGGIYGWMPLFTKQIVAGNVTPELANDVLNVWWKSGDRLQQSASQEHVDELFNACVGKGALRQTLFSSLLRAGYKVPEAFEQLSNDLNSEFWAIVALDEDLLKLPGVAARIAECLQQTSSDQWSRLATDAVYAPALKALCSHVVQGFDGLEQHLDAYVASALHEGALLSGTKAELQVLAESDLAENRYSLLAASLKHLSEPVYHAELIHHAIWRFLFWNPPETPNWSVLPATRLGYLASGYWAHHVCRQLDYSLFNVLFNNMPSASALRFWTECEGDTNRASVALYRLLQIIAQVCQTKRWNTNADMFDEFANELVREITGNNKEQAHGNTLVKVVSQWKAAVRKMVVEGAKDRIDATEKVNAYLAASGSEQRITRK